MPTIAAESLNSFVKSIFIAARVGEKDAVVVADALVRANLVGHDSHGVLRVPDYVWCVENGWVVSGADIQAVADADAFAVLDGGWGFGQVVAARAMEIAISKAARSGVAVVSVRNCGHIGRVGDYPLMAAAQGMAAMLFVNVHGGGVLVAPWGGRERRLSANPIAIAVPRADEPPLLVDISTCAIAEGKLRSYLRRGIPAPPNAVIDSAGNPTTDPADFYANPPGAMLPFGGHKGFALGLVTDILAGALSGAGCSRPRADRAGNSFTAIVLNVSAFRSSGAFADEVNAFVEYVKSSALAPGFDAILVPGEPEEREKERREREGIPVDDTSWRLICDTATRLGVAHPAPNELR